MGSVPGYPASGQPAPSAASNWLYVPPGWDTLWQASKAGSSAAPGWLAVIGTSISAGSVANDQNNNGYIGLVRAYLLKRYGLYADYWPTTMSLSWTPGFTGTPPWVMNDAVSNWYAWGFGELPLYTGTPANPIMTFTTPYPCTALDILYFEFNVGNFHYAVDGGAAVQVNTVAGNYFKRVQLSGLSNAQHTVVLTAQSGSNVMIIGGVVTYNSTAGIGFGRIAYGGALAVDLAGNGQPADPCLLLQGGGAATTGFGFPTQPHLGIIELGINDCTNAQPAGNGASPTQYKRILTRIVQAFRRGQPNCSIILIAPSNPDGVSSDVTSGLFGNPGSWHLYMAAMSDVAKDYGCAFLSIHGKWGETGVAQGFQAANQPHPNTAGHADIANVLESII